MNENIKRHIDGLFSEAEITSQMLDIKEELLANLNDKYDDLVSQGKSEEEAFSLVISGIGDIQDLICDVSKDEANSPLKIEKSRKIRSAFVSLGVSLYIMSLAIGFIFERFALEDMGFVVMVLIWAVATGLIVYGANVGKIVYKKANDTFVEEYKEKLSKHDRRGKLRGAFSSSLWSLVVVVYLAVSFFTGLWAYTWIIFLLGSFLQQAVVFAFSGEKTRKNIWHGLLWNITLVVYFIISFGFNSWAFSWMIFPIAAAAGQMGRLVILWKSEE